MKYITTPIYYPNGDPHIGHAYTTILGDVLKRVAAMNGEETFYTTGVDEHGQKIQSAIEKSGVSEQQFLDNKANVFKTLFNDLNIQYDFFVRTTSENHMKVVQDFLQKIYERGYIIKKKYSGLYCEGCEMFKRESDLDENGNCPQHQKKPVLVEEENYFFRLEPFRNWLVEYIKNHPNWIQPNYFATEILNMLKEPLEDLCISRPASRVKLGVSLPFDNNYVAYIWFDALVNYISSIKDKSNRSQLWANSVHLMGKDIIKPHCIYWPIMLKAMDLNPVNHVFVHGFLTGESGIKMSKSIGNVVDPMKVINTVGTDALRMFMATNVSDKDIPVSEKNIIEFYQLMANTIGNLHMRSCKLLEKYESSTVPTVSLNEADVALLTKISSTLSSNLKSVRNFADISRLSTSLLQACSDINSYISRKEPWVIAKRLPETQKELDSCLYTILDVLRIVATALYPIAPNTAVKILDTLKINSTDIKIANVSPNKLRPGSQIKEATILFPKLDIMQKGKQR